jgi:hypothetical protein
MRKMRLIIIAMLLTVSGFAQEEKVSVEFAGTGYFREFDVKDFPKGVMMPDNDSTIIVNMVLDQYKWDLSDIGFHGVSNVVVIAYKDRLDIIGRSVFEYDVKVGDVYKSSIPFDSKKYKHRKHLRKI